MRNPGQSISALSYIPVLTVSELCGKVAQSQGMRTVPEEMSLGGDDFSYYMEEETMGRQIQT